MICILFASLAYAHNVKWTVPKPVTALAPLGFCLALLAGCLVVPMVCVSTPCLGDSHLTVFRVGTRMKRLSSCTNMHKYPCKMDVYEFSIFLSPLGMSRSQEEHECWQKVRAQIVSRVLLGFTLLCSPWTPQTTFLLAAWFKQWFIP